MPAPQPHSLGYPRSFPRISQVSHNPAAKGFMHTHRVRLSGCEMGDTLATILDSKYFTSHPRDGPGRPWRGAIGTGHRTTSSTSQRTLSALRDKTTLHRRPQFQGLFLVGQWVSQFLSLPEAEGPPWDGHAVLKIRGAAMGAGRMPADGVSLSPNEKAMPRKGIAWC